ncbi:hypothetical protein OE810_02475 [Rhodobacteraceae bacterium XHP0102]|nr:hypothetical protein [Rhodobacteraceae bacterium XHP0102]
MNWSTDARALRIIYRQFFSNGRSECAKMRAFPQIALTHYCASPASGDMSNAPDQ